MKFKAKRKILLLLFCYIFFSIFSNLFCEEDLKKNTEEEIEKNADLEFLPQTEENRLPPPVNPPFSPNFPEAEHAKPSKKEKTEVQIRCNVHGAAVFLNGEYKGTTPLIITNLLPGNYELKIEKQGFKTSRQIIRVQNGTSYVYSVQLENITGLLEIENLPENCNLTIAGNTIFRQNRIRLSEGFHSIKIRKFGFKEISETIFINRHSLSKFSVSLEEADFEITSFTAAKKTFNPEYKNNLGKAAFYVGVTAPGNGKFYIYDDSDNLIYTSEDISFYTWNQIFYWDGKSSSLEDVPDGKYKVIIEAEDFSKSLSVTIDRSLFFHLLDITPYALGVGSVPASFTMPKGTFLNSYGAETFFSNKTGFYAVEISTDFSAYILKQLSLIAGYRIFAQKDETPMTANIALNFSNDVKINNSNTKFSYGASVGYGASNFSEDETIKIPTGTGLNLCTSVGVESKKISTSISSAFVLGGTSGNPANGDNFWKNGISFSVTPKPEFSVDFSALLTSDSNPFDSIDLYAGFSYLIPSTIIILKGGTSLRQYLTNSERYQSVRLSLAFLL